jgi:hypothetical protein
MQAADLSTAQYERLVWELQQRGFAPRNLAGPYSDFDFSGLVAVEVTPAGVGLYRVNIRNGAAKAAAEEALWVARMAR